MARYGGMMERGVDGGKGREQIKGANTMIQPTGRWARMLSLSHHYSDFLLPMEYLNSREAKALEFADCTGRCEQRGDGLHHIWPH